uniref:Natterin-3 n=1 Tax=Lygus hesperus TaxID=30085 RepID=A0A0A9YIM4_LYGHE
MAKFMIRPTNIRWLSMSKGRIPDNNAVRGGQDSDGCALYIGRTNHNGDVLPCKINPRRGFAYFSYAGREISVENYEALASKTVGWQRASGGQLPDRAIRIGQTAEGEPLYVGRAVHEGFLTPGKFHPSHRCVYVPYNGREHRYDNYEVMVMV